MVQNGICRFDILCYCGFAGTWIFMCFVWKPIIIVLILTGFWNQVINDVASEKLKNTLMKIAGKNNAIKMWKCFIVVKSKVPEDRSLLFFKKNYYAWRLSNPFVHCNKNSVAVSSFELINIDGLMNTRGGKLPSRKNTER
jgi:hypothetical protein